MSVSKSTCLIFFSLLSSSCKLAGTECVPTDVTCRPELLMRFVVVQTSAGQSHSCALMDTGRVRCFGFGDRGRLGYGNLTNVPTPSVAGDVDTGTTVAQVSAAVLHTCVVLKTGWLRCWGVADNGRLGYGNLNIIGDDEKPATLDFVPVGTD